MLSGEGNKNSERTTMGLISKKETLHAQHTFFCTFLCCCFNLHDNNVKLPESSQLHVLWRKCHLCSCSLFTFFSLPLIFTQLSDLWYFSFSHCHYKIFMLFFQQKMFPLFFISCSIQLSVALFLVELRWSVTYFLFLYTVNCRL